MLRHPYVLACVFALLVVALLLPGSTTLLGNILASVIGLATGLVAALLAGRGA